MKERFLKPLQLAMTLSLAGMASPGYAAPPKVIINHDMDKNLAYFYGNQLMIPSSQIVTPKADPKEDLPPHLPIQPVSVKPDLQSLPIPKGVNTPTWMEVAEAVAKKYPVYKIPVAVPLAQFKIEQGGQPNSLNNLFGISGMGPAGESRQGFKMYQSVDQGIEDYLQIVSGYPTVKRLTLNKSTDPVGFFRALKEANYATDPNYVLKLTQAYQENRLDQYNKLTQDNQSVS